ncbi:MAG: hypothetical protein RLZZ413_995, partial [Pseudomonadota bacterium]
MDAVGRANVLISGSQEAPKNVTLDTAKVFLSQHSVRYLLVQFVDIHGVVKSKSVPVDHLDDLLTDGAGFAGAGVWGLGMQPHEAEYIVKADIETLTLLPWLPGYARMMGTGYNGTKIHSHDTRNILKT